MKRFSTRRLPAWATTLLVVAGVLLGGRITFASHNFSDVPTSALYHDAAEWLLNRAITLGCASGLYCPNDVVTRAQMALFMNRLGVALTPSFIEAGGNAGALDIDVAPRICQTTDFTATFPRRARVDVWVSLEAAGSMATLVRIEYSTDGGGVWTQLSLVMSQASASTTGEWAHVSSWS